MVQNTANPIFRLDFITHILPLENLIVVEGSMRAICGDCFRHGGHFDPSGLFVVGLGNSDHIFIIREMAAAEDENLTFALSHGEQLGCDQVRGREDNPEGDEDTHITSQESVALARMARVHDDKSLPPFVRMVVLVLLINICVSMDRRRAECISDLCTGPVFDADSTVVATGGDHDRARE